MIVTAALCWWNEKVEDLERCVAGVAQIADRIVALDGAYSRYPDATPTSSPEQAEAIRKTARKFDLDCLVLTPDRVWAGQVEKRTYLLNAAAIGSDWVVVVDTDHVIHCDREGVLTELAELPMDVVEVPFYTPANPHRSIPASSANQWHIDQADIVQMTPHIYRALPGFRVERFHWWYSAIKDGRRVWLWGGDSSYPPEDHYRFKSFYQVEHRCLLRSDRYIAASRTFLDDRERVVKLTGQEDDQDGLPRP
jgi:hypothetical protein